VFLAIVRLKERGNPIRQADIALEAGIGERTLATYRANNAMLSNLIDSAILFCLDQHILKTGRRLETEGGPVTYSRIALEASVAVETLRRRREANRELNRTLEYIISATHPSDLKIMAAVERLRKQDKLLAYADVAGEADVDPATLRTRMYANPRLRDAVNTVVLTTDSRILKAIDRLVAENADIDQKAIAEHAGLDAGTVTNRKNNNALIRAAIERAIRSTDDRIMAAVQTLTARNIEITQNLIAEEARVSAGTIVHRKEQNPAIRRIVDDTVSNCMYRLMVAAIRQINEEGATVTQQLIAQKLNLSEAAIVYHKDRDPDIHELVETALPLSPVNRIRNARDELLAENMPCTQKNLTLRTGVSQATVSRVLARNPDLAKGVIAERPKGIVYATVEACKEALVQRIRLYGNEICNTISALRKPVLRGGNPALLRACRRLVVPLPVPQTERAKRMAAGKAVLPEYNPLSTYLERINATPVLLEHEAVMLWERARRGDRDAQEQLVVGTRPLVKFVIENNLNEQVDPSSFKVELLWHLITEGDMIIAAALPAWDRKGRFLGFLHRRLQSGLTTARHDFFRQRQQRAMRESSIDEPLGDPESGSVLTPANSRTMAAHNMQPDEVLAILSEESVFGEEELVRQRDAASGIPVVSIYDKQVMASTLKSVFTALDLSTSLESGLGNKWALIMADSLGRMGTAVVGSCSFKAMVLTDATSVFLRQSLPALAAKLNAAMTERPDGVTTLVIGRGADYDRVMELTNGRDPKWNGLRHFVMGLQHFGVGLTPEEGIAAIDFIPVESKLSHAALFELLKNGLLCAESESDARSALVRYMLQHHRNGSPEDAGRALLDAQVCFLRDQRARLERMKRRMRRDS